jgi:DNA-binding SARP family transcriptional activator
MPSTPYAGSEPLLRGRGQPTRTKGPMDEHERRASFQEDEIERKLRLGQHMELFPEVLDAVEVEPFRERRWRQLMLALYRSGRTVESLRQFQRLRTLLGEVGRHPSAETEELERAILQQRPELDWTGPESITY